MNVSRFSIGNNFTEYFSLLLMVLVFWSSNAQSIDYSEKEMTIDSELLDEKRQIKIYFPDDDDSPKMTINVLDGNWNNELVKGVAAHWVKWGLSSDIAAVGIDNMGFTTRDFTPTNVTGELQQQNAPSQRLIPFSTNEVETSIAFTPDENIAFVSRHKGKWGQRTNPPSTIYEYRKNKDHWKLIGPALMSNLDDGNSDSDVFVSYDGKELFFVSDRPYKGKNDRDGDIWKSTRVGGEWTNPKPVAEVNSKGYEASPVTDKNGNLYFSSMREGGKGLGDIYLAKRRKDGSYDKPEPIQGDVNAESGEWNLVVGPKADWMVFESSGRSEGMSPYGDFYLSKKMNGRWTKPVHLKELNSTGSELNPRFLIASGRLVFISSKTLKSTNANVYEVKKDFWNKYVQTNE